MGLSKGQDRNMIGRQDRVDEGMATASWVGVQISRDGRDRGNTSRAKKRRFRLTNEGRTWRKTTCFNGLYIRIVVFLTQERRFTRERLQIEAVRLGIDVDRNQGCLAQNEGELRTRHHS